MSATGVASDENPVPEAGWPGALLVGWVAASATLMAWGYGLSTVHALASRPGWVLGAVIAAAAAVTGGRVALLRSNSNAVSLQPRERGLVALIILYVGVAAVLLAGIVTAFASAPSNWDSLTYHLARVGYYLQQGSLADFGANYFPQEQQARGASILQSAILTLSGKSDRLVGLPQLLGYVMCLVAVYVLARQSARGVVAAAAAAAVFGLVTIVAVEAPTAQNDLVLVSYLGAGLVGGIGYLQRGGRGMLLLGGGGFALALAVKASALTCVPGAALVLAVVAGRTSATRHVIFRRITALALAVAVVTALFAAPGGYWKNWRRFGSPIGGPPMMGHASGPEMGISRWRMGAVNAVRFAGDFFTLDGLPEKWGGAAGNRIKRVLGRGAKALGFDAESAVATRSPFSWTRPRLSDENVSFFGWMGAVILIPGCLGAFVLWRRQPVGVAFAAAFAVFCVGQAIAGPYDPWRGRLFLYGAIFAAPGAAWLFEAGGSAIRRLAWGAAIVGAVAIIPALLWRSPNPLLPRPGAKSIFNLGRLEQMAVHHDSYPALAAFERLVPAHARVVVGMPDNEYEYVFFGRGLTRRLIPISQTQLHPELMETADFLVYDGRLRLPRLPTDIPLGYRWALRRLSSLRPADFDFISGLHAPEEGFAWMADEVHLRLRPAAEKWVNLEIGARLPGLPPAEAVVIRVDGVEFRAAFREEKISVSVPLSAGLEHDLRVVSPTGARTPLQLGLSADPRPLSYRVRILEVSDRALFPLIH